MPQLTIEGQLEPKDEQSEVRHRIAGLISSRRVRSSASLAEYLVELFFRREVRPLPADGEEFDESAALTDPASSEFAERPGEALIVEDRATTQTDEAGYFRLTVPEEDELTGPTVRFVVSAPSGKTVGDTTLAPEALRAPVTLQVDALDQVALEPPRSPNGHRPST
jgi:hypothetical protein